MREKYQARTLLHCYYDINFIITFCLLLLLLLLQAPLIVIIIINLIVMNYFVCFRRVHKIAKSEN
jgi:hypothetical protein